MNKLSPTYVKKVIDQLLKIQQDVEEEKNISNKLVKQNTKDIDSIVSIIEDKILDKKKGGANMLRLSEQSAKTIIRRFIYLFLAVAGLVLAHRVYDTKEAFDLVIKQNLDTILKRVELFVKSLNYFGDETLYDVIRFHIISIGLYSKESDETRDILQFYKMTGFTVVSTGLLITSVNIATDSIYNTFVSTNQKKRLRQSQKIMSRTSPNQSQKISSPRRSERLAFKNATPRQSERLALKNATSRQSGRSALKNATSRQSERLGMKRARDDNLDEEPTKKRRFTESKKANYDGTKSIKSRKNIHNIYNTRK